MMLWPDNATDLPPSSANHSSESVFDLQQDLQCNNLLRFLINSICAGALCIIGFLGNILSYLVLGRDQEMLPVARLLLRSLAVADNTFLMLWFAHFSISDLFVYIGVDRMTTSATWLYVRLATYPVLFMGQTATIWLTVLIAATRYIIVCHPTRGTLYCSLDATRKGVAAVVIFSIIYNSPRFFDVQVATNENGTNYLNHTDLGLNQLYNFLYMDAMYYVFGFILPLLLLSIFNIHLIIAYRNFRRKRAALRMRTGPGDSEEQNVTLIMIVVILVFMVCNAPAKTVQIVLTYRVQRCMTGEFFARELSIVLELLNSSVNFIVYCVGLKRFQDHLPCCSRPRTRTIEMEKYQLTASTTSGRVDEVSASV